MFGFAVKIHSKLAERTTWNIPVNSQHMIQDDNQMHKSKSKRFV
jgi:hypothetical protein